MQEIESNDQQINSSFIRHLSKHWLDRNLEKYENGKENSEFLALAWDVGVEMNSHPAAPFIGSKEGD